MENRAMPRAGEFYMHFKGKLYQIVTVAIHTETEESIGGLSGNVWNV